ncbi:phosphoribosylamine--glycine ligase [Clostridium tunisiense]|uniref:phosphoribosylamine--glycine ligase n=1 Tax=Clostridium tunisiense TaxID=219748 RepID=UPI0002F51ACD|nr:phosphoribosylamine--glycine ligase [Clostridium tunisiense]
MKVLLIGSGGREHAIAWKLSQSILVNKIFCAPGNGGTATEEKCENVNITNNEELLKFAIDNSIDVTVVGPEAPLCEGIVDSFSEKGLKIFGPCAAGAQLEGSKIFSKNFMKKYNINTAAYDTFTHADEAIQYLETCKFPVVLKADGLAAGKGVIIAQDYNEAKIAIEELMISDILRGAGKSVVIEEFLQGVEASILAITDGETIIPFVSSKDHKAIYDGNLGPNTGGMGTLAPNPYCTEKVLQDFKDKIMYPTLQGLQKENIQYKGIIFFGLMITKDNVYLLEYNVRMGDPETQVVLPLMESDFMELIMSTIDGNLSSKTVSFKDEFACCVIAASKGYPGTYEVGKEINIANNSSEKVFIAGGKISNSKLLSSGGRVLGVTALGKSIEEARKNAYVGINNIDFEGIYFRGDIGI